MSDFSLKDWKDLGDMLSAFATTAVIIGGAILAWLGFFRDRVTHAKIETDINVNDVLVPEKSLRLVRVSIGIKNIGNPIARFSNAELRLRQVAPIQKQILDTFESGFDPIEAGKSQILWPVLSQRKFPLA